MTTRLAAKARSASVPRRIHSAVHRQSPSLWISEICSISERKPWISQQKAVDIDKCRPMLVHCSRPGFPQVKGPTAVHCESAPACPLVHRCARFERPAAAGPLVTHAGVARVARIGGVLRVLADAGAVARLADAARATAAHAVFAEARLARELARARARLSLMFVEVDRQGARPRYEPAHHRTVDETTRSQLPTAYEHLTSCAPRPGPGGRPVVVPLGAGKGAPSLSAVYLMPHTSLKM